jgi:hypothetical protein
MDDWLINEVARELYLRGEHSESWMHYAIYNQWNIYALSDIVTLSQRTISKESRDGSLERGDPWGPERSISRAVSIVLELYAQLNTVLHTY